MATLLSPCFNFPCKKEKDIKKSKLCFLCKLSCARGQTSTFKLGGKIQGENFKMYEKSYFFSPHYGIIHPCHSSAIMYKKFSIVLFCAVYHVVFYASAVVRDSPVRDLFSLSLGRQLYINRILGVS